jgi:dihydroorotate dehydrogenase
MGLDFPNPVGLAAGLGQEWGTPGCASHALGFGFLEIGTVTPRPQPGNPAPQEYFVFPKPVL